MIASVLLGEVADYMNDRVAKVVLNGSYEITDFVVKEVTGNVLALNYIVPASAVSLVETVELKDESNIVLTSNAVSIPIEADHLMLQTVSVKEVT